MARAQPWYTILPTTTSPPDTAALPPAAGASAATAWDHLESDIQALKQQALATQKSIQALQAHEPPNPLQAVQSGLPTLPTDWDAPVVGVAAALGLTLALVWWALWVRPQSRLRRAEAAFAADAPPAMAQDDGATAEHGAADSPFARHDPNPGFDSEAAASEVMRVRKSLAEKREARAQQREYEETANPVQPQVRAWLDQNGPQPLDGVVVTSGPIPIATRAPDPVPPPLEPVPTVIDVTQPEPVMELDLDLGPVDADPESETLRELLSLPPSVLTEAPMPEPKPQELPETEESMPEHAAWPDTDFGITLALAQESEALDLWLEARELATEVLESQTPELRGEAQALLERLDARDQALAREAAQPAPEEPDGTGSVSAGAGN